MTSDFGVRMAIILIDCGELILKVIRSATSADLGDL
jgi:hypothetical protein